MATGTDRLIAVDAPGYHRAVERQAAGGKRQYWVQAFACNPEWDDRWGPYYQRPAVLRKLAEYGAPVYEVPR